MNLQKNRSCIQSPSRAQGRRPWLWRVLGTGVVFALLSSTLQAENRSAPAVRPASPPQHWRGLIAEYSTDTNTRHVIILERTGRLRAVIDTDVEQTLEELSRDTYRAAPSGTKPAATFFFQRENDVSTTLELDGNTLARRDGDKDTVFRIEPLEPVNALRERALAATPPPEKREFLEADLIDLARVGARLHFDIRYATTNNFMGAAFYRRPQAFLQRPAANALLRVAERVERQGFGLLVYDGYRPWHVTKMFWDATPDPMKDFVADPTKGSRHNRGCAVDLTLCDPSNGKPVAMVSGYDEFRPRAAADYPGGTSLERWHRKILRDAMEAEHFRVLSEEWWHFDYQEWRRYPILNQTFDVLRPLDE